MSSKVLSLISGKANSTCMPTVADPEQLREVQSVLFQVCQMEHLV